MSLGEELFYKAHPMEVEDDFYSYDEDEPVFEDSAELLAALRRKEDDLLLAAQVGNALLMETRQLKEERDGLLHKHAQEMEDLQQQRYELQVKLESLRAQWDGQVSELERDVQELQAQADGLRRGLAEAELEKKRLERDSSEQSLRLREQLQRGSDVERTMSGEIQRLKQEMMERGNSRPQDEELISALREQVARLSQREQTLEQLLKTTSHENEQLRDSVTSLHTRLDLQEQQGHTHIQQLAEAWREAERLRSWAQELQARVEELQDEAALQETSRSEVSLLSELEHSIDADDWSRDREQVSREVRDILDLLGPVVFSSEPEPCSSDGLQGMLGQLRHTAQLIAQRQTPQDMRTSIVFPESDPCEKAVQIQELRDQNERLAAENKLLTETRVDEEVLQQAIKDRDDAIAKKTAMEAELLRTKHDMMCLNNQLLEAIQRKLELSQELEAWQEDIQIIINQQLRSQQQSEQQQKRPAGRLSFLRKSRKVQTKPEIRPDQNQSPWRDWIRPNK